MSFLSSGVDISRNNPSPSVSSHTQKPQTQSVNGMEMMDSLNLLAASSPAKNYW
jgi:hypothetical protein